MICNHPLEKFCSEDLTKIPCLQQHEEHITSTSVKPRQRIREILPTSPWCCIILTNLRRATIISTCFQSFLLLLPHLPCVLLLLQKSSSLSHSGCKIHSCLSEMHLQLLRGLQQVKIFIYLPIVFLHIKISLIYLSVSYSTMISMYILCQSCKLSELCSLRCICLRVTNVIFCVIPASPNYCNKSCP